MDNFWAGFNKVAESANPMKKRIVIFTASWSQPSKKLLRDIERLRPRFPRVPVEVIDVEDDRALASRLQIKNVPRVMVVRGQRIDKNTILQDDAGAIEPDRITELFEGARV